MKKTIIILLLAFSALKANAQENSSPKLKLYSATLGFGFFSFKKAAYEGGGAAFLADVTASLDKNLLSASYLTGAEIGILDRSSYQIYEFSLLYGREWKAANWIRFEGFAGLGYYHQQVDGLDNPEDVPPGSSVSFPLRLNTKFYFTQKFGMGFNTNYSINSVNNTFSTNLIFHYRFS